MTGITRDDFLNRRVLVFDSETTGIEEPEVMQFAWLELDKAAYASPFFLLDHPETEDYPGASQLCKTVKPCTNGAYATHGLIPSVYDGSELLFDFDGMVGNDTVLIGHQIDFDWVAAGRPPGIPLICTLAMARRLFPNESSHKLGALVYMIKGANEDTLQIVRAAHGAGADVMMTAMVLMHMLKELPHIRSWYDLWSYSEDARLPRKFTFGKYYGTDMTIQRAVVEDKGYVKWIRGNKHDDPHLLVALDKAEQGLLTP